MKVITCTHCGSDSPVNARFCSRCGASLQGLQQTATPPTVLPGTQLRNRYFVIRQIGQGGFGKTYLAEDTGRFNHFVVIKEFTPTNQSTYALQKAEELFEREAKILHDLHHPQIPRFWEFFQENRRLFLVQDFVEGQTYEFILSQRQQQGRCFSETEVVQLLQKLLPVLSYLHERGIIHRDIAPDNIICRTQDGLPVLIDLGGVKQIAVEVAKQIANTKNPVVAPTRLGKVGYAPDEQLRLGIVAPHSDLYALAVTAIVLMAGKQPQDLIDPHTLKWTWHQVVKVNPLLSGLLNRMLAPEPVDRFQSATEVLQALNPPLAETVVNQTLLANTSGQGRVFDHSVKVPSEIIGWNWGAFFLPGLWCLTNHVWIGLVAWLDPTLISSLLLPWFTTGVVLGAKGNEWAWKSRSWRSIEAFKAHQRAWAIAGWSVAMSILLLIILLVLFLIGLAVRATMGGMK